jgi:hypothetical protein
MKAATPPVGSEADPTVGPMLGYGAIGALIGTVAGKLLRV